MGEVFAAHDPLLGREVAIKIGRSTEPLDQDRFLNEARHAARVVHPNLVAIFDVGVHRDAGFIAMELVHGTSLTQLVRRGPLDWMVVASIGVGVSAGLAALHDAALVHRDVKPGNLMLSTSGTMKVVDFGIAAAEGTPHLDAFEGSPGYIAPELILGEPPRRGADVFSLGVVLHELVMGARLFDGDTAAARALAVTQRTAPRLPAGRVPDWFAELVAACLLPDPHERPKHAGHVLAVLRAHEPFASLLAIGSGVTTSGELGREERTAFSLSSGPMVGRETICARLSERIARREGASISLHGRSGLGKTRMVSELAARCDLGTVLIVEEARGRAALAAALGLDSGREEAALRSALRELAPIFVALEDVPSGAVASDLSALVREEVPDALAVFTSGQAYEGVAFDETIGLEPLSPSEAEQLFAGRSRGGSGQLARAVAPLASGHPLSLELLARAIGPSDHDLGGVRGEDAMGSLVERSLRSVSIAARRCAERLALAGVRGAAFLGDAGTLAELARSGFLEQKEHGPALHAAIRESLLEALGRERRTEAVGREVLELLHREVMRLEAGAHGADAAEARRGLVHLRGEVVVAAQPVLADPSLDALGWVTQMLFSTLDWSLPTYDDAILVWSQLIGVLHRVGAEDEVLARAHLGRAWAHDSDLEASGRDVDEALIRARNGALRCELLAVRGSLLKRRGLSAEADAAFASLTGGGRTFPWEPAPPEGGGAEAGGGAGGAASDNAAAAGPGPGHRNEKIAGPYKELIGGALVVTTPGNVKWQTSSMCNIGVGGAHSTKALEAGMRVLGASEETLGSLHVTAKAVVGRTVKGAIATSVGGSLKIHAKGGVFAAKAGSKITIQSAGAMKCKGGVVVFVVGGSMVAVSDGGVLVKAGTIKIKGATKQSGDTTH